MKIVKEHINEKFEETSDPIEDMGIGAIEATSNVIFLKKLPLSKLEELYKRVHNDTQAQVLVDGVMFVDLSRRDQIEFNNRIVNAMRYVRSHEKRDEVRKQKFKEGDIIKCYYKNKWNFGKVLFTKRGIVRTDNKGRIVLKTSRGYLKVPLSYAILSNTEEQQQYEFINKKIK